MTGEPAYQTPHLNVEPGRIAVAWETEAVEFAFERFRTDRRSAEMTAELSVWDTLSAIQIIGGIRANLTSGRARTEVTNSLDKRLKRERQDWGELVEASFRLARERSRQGEPSILLRDAPRREASFALEPLYTASGGTVVHGDGGTLKSLLALAAGIDLHRGSADILGLAPTRAMRVLFLDWEWDAAVHRERMASLIAPGDPMPDLAYLRCESPINDELERIQAAIRKHRSEFLLIDSVAWAAGDDPETSNSAKGFYAATRQLGLPFVGLAHQTKAGEQTKPFGSVFWFNGARLTWQQTSERNIGETTARIGLVNRKQSDDGPSPAPLGWEMSKQGARTVFRRINAASIDSVASRMPVRERAINLLVSGAMTYAEIAEELGEEVRTVRSTIDRDMRQRGERSPFVKLPGEDNVYRIGLRAWQESAA